MLYDIYLSIGCRKLPNMEDLFQNIPLLIDPTFQKKLLTPSPHRPGFLGLDISEDLAKQLLLRLKVVNAVGQLVPSIYRTPQITQEQALGVARMAIEKKQREQFSDRRIKFIYLKGDLPRFWVFDAILDPEIKIEGAGIPVGVDKLDGHIWNKEELLALEKMQEKLDEK